MGKGARKQPPGARLSAEDWERAALSALAQGGVTAVAVEPLARRLGVTKGSFYWHYRDRDALLEAALVRWETESTDAIIATVSTLEDPRARLGGLFREVGRKTSVRSAELYLAIAAAATDPRVRPFLERVTERRIDFIAACYRDLGLCAEDGRARALLAYAAYIGVLHLRREAPNRSSPGEGDLETLFELLLPSRST